MRARALTASRPSKVRMTNVGVCTRLRTDTTIFRSALTTVYVQGEGNGIEFYMSSGRAIVSNVKTAKIIFNSFLEPPVLLWV